MGANTLLSESVECKILSLCLRIERVYGRRPHECQAVLKLYQADCGVQCSVSII